MKQPVQAHSDAAGLHCPAGYAANPGIRILILVSLAMLGLFVCAHATASSRSYDGAFTFTLENDAFTGSDSNYTNGLGFAWSTNELGGYDQSEFPARWGRFWSFLPYIGDEGYQTYASWTIGQQMHTPDDITDSTACFTPAGNDGVIPSVCASASLAPRHARTRCSERFTA